MADGSPWPRISIVTPSFNQRPFLEEAIRSVLLQGYPDLEYLIIDGGSEDGSVGIIKKYSKWLYFWTSKKDVGQSHALNKGFSKTSGDICAYISCDDIYEPNAFRHIAHAFERSPRPDVVAGNMVIFDAKTIKSEIRSWWPDNPGYFFEKPFNYTMSQEATFYDARFFRSMRGFDESLHFCFDLEFGVRAGLKGAHVLCIPDYLARFREHPDSKSTSQRVRFCEEQLQLLIKFGEACGISGSSKRLLVRRTQCEIHYLKVFEHWKRSGRGKAWQEFARMLSCRPVAILDRRVLAQLRRLMFFNASEVLELKNLKTGYPPG
jgi:glycosyltransferase involved in cell wall biosynthesis